MNTSKGIHRHVPVWMWMLMLAVASFIAGIWIFRNGIIIWDDTPLHLHSQWLLSNYGIGEAPNGLSDNGKWTAPLWPLVLGIGTEILFAWFRDPFVIRHALTFALLPMSLAGCYLLLRKAGIARSAAALAVALLIGDIRLMGASTVALRDFPAAMGWLLSALGLWIVLKRWQDSGGGQRRVGARALCCAGMISVVPFLLRSPVILPFVLLMGFVVCVALSPSQLRVSHRIAVMGIPCVAGLVCIFALSPMLWKLPQDWVHPFQLFSSFPFGGSVRAFGMTFKSSTLPLWYPFVWFPLRYHPLALAMIVFGCIAAVLRPQDREAVRLPFFQWPIAFSLLHWLLLVQGAIWLVIVLLRPDVYDEDRHLHFLFALFPVIAAIGAEHLLSQRVQWALSVLIVLLSAVAVAMWGPYSYIYKSPIIGNREPQRFLADYRGVCIVEAFNALHTVIPGGIHVVLDGPNYEAAAHLKRLNESRIAPHPDWAKGYILSRDRNKLDSYALITYDSLNFAKKLRQDVSAGTAKLVWQTLMPPGVPACMMGVYGVK